MSRSRRTTSRLPLFLSERVSARGVYRAREIDKAWGNRRKSLERRPEVPGFPYVVGENGKWQSPRNDAPAILFDRLLPYYPWNRESESVMCKTTHPQFYV